MKKNLFAKLLAVVIIVVALVATGMSFFSHAPKPEDPVIVNPIDDPVNNTDPVNNNVQNDPGNTTVEVKIDEDGVYYSKDEVALYIITYHKLPGNYISKTKAKKQGWIQEKGNLWDVCKGCSIGGGPFNNSEGTLPEDDYYECDIDYSGGNRNAKRLVYTKWGTVYYTDDHYKTFELLYGEEDD